MKAKLLLILVLLCLTSTACYNSSIQTVNNNEINTNQKLTFDENSSANARQDSTKENNAWNVVENRCEDIDNDGKKDDITLSFYEEKDAIKKFKITINESEKVLFDSQKTFSLISFNIKQLVNLDNGEKGVLIKLNSEGETANQDSKSANPSWFDHSFFVIGYTKGKIITLLDGINQPYNSDNNYKIKYIGDYNIEFCDNATNFIVKYAATLYKSTDDGIKRLKAINDNQSSNISSNYFNVEAQDTNADGIDEIICSKYIPGLYHADLLGIIDYTFAFRNGKYSLSKETLEYDGDSGSHTVKQMEIS